jgi:hypothetical protein
VQLAEARGPLANLIKTRFTELDANKDGGLDAAEFQPISSRMPGRPSPDQQAQPAAPAQAQGTESGGGQ